jgi:hypothetical protein
MTIGLYSVTEPLTLLKGIVRSIDPSALSTRIAHLNIRRRVYGKALELLNLELTPPCLSDAIDTAIQRQ